MRRKWRIKWILCYNPWTGRNRNKISSIFSILNFSVGDLPSLVNYNIPGLPQWVGNLSPHSPIVAKATSNDCPPEEYCFMCHLSSEHFAMPSRTAELAVALQRCASRENRCSTRVMVNPEEECICYTYIYIRICRRTRWWLQGSRWSDPRCALSRACVYARAGREL